MARAAQESPNGAVERLKVEAGGLVNALADRAVSSVRGKVEDATSRLTGLAEGDHGPGLIAAAAGARSLAEGKGPVRSLVSAGLAGIKEKVAAAFERGTGKGGRGSKKLKLTTILETIDVGVPLRLAYDQWNQFSEFPSFMKKVESAERVEDTKLSWKAQVFWSHRTWESTIVDQHPDERIVWRSKGQKGHVDGAVTFHELGPTLTRIVLVLEYHPQGMFEHTGNIWRAQGRRARLELKHFARHVMTSTVLQPDQVEGWRGTIEDSKVVQDHETALREEGREPGKTPERDEADPMQPADEASETDGASETEGEYEATDRRGESPAGEADEAAHDTADDTEDGDRDRQGRGQSRRRPAPARTARSRPRSTGDQPQRRAQGATPGGGKQ